MSNFWLKLKKPIMILAPMADVTDAAFRRLIAKYGKPDVMWTEFVSADGLAHPTARPKLMRDLEYTEAERPIVAQLFGGVPENMETAARLAAKLGFDGIDINMGCPDRGVEKQGAGATLIKNSRRAREIIRAAHAGAPDLPISVKTRIGYNKNELATWLPELLAEDLAAVTIHARTRKEMSLVPARWEHVREAVAIRDSLKLKTLVIGNGDVDSVADAIAKCLEYGADGAMLGRAIFGNPFLFAEQKEDSRFMNHDSCLRAKLTVMLEHTKLFDELFISPRLTGLDEIRGASEACDQGVVTYSAGANERSNKEVRQTGKSYGFKNFAVMKKHYKAYVSGFDGAKELRVKLMETESAKEVENITEEYLKTL